MAGEILIIFFINNYENCKDCFYFRHYIDGSKEFPQKRKSIYVCDLHCEKLSEINICKNKKEVNLYGLL